MIEEQVNFYQHRESYQVLSHPYLTHEQLGGATSTGEWGSMLHGIFTPENDAQFRWDKWSTLRGKAMYVFAYQVQKEHGYVLRDRAASKQYICAYTGFVYADAKSSQIQRITMKAVDIPRDFAIKRLELRLDYQPTDIAGHIYTLPSGYELEADDNNGHRENKAEFKSYQVYEAEVTLKYEGTRPALPAKKQP
jgi:hypothetical protein